MAEIAHQPVVAEEDGPRQRIARFVTDWRVILCAVLGLLGGGAWGYAKWSGVVKKPDLAGVATQADVQRAVDAHAAQPGHAEELRQHEEERAQIKALDEKVTRVDGKVEKLDGKVDTILQIMRNSAGPRR